MLPYRVEQAFMRQLIEIWEKHPNDLGAVSTTLTLSEFDLPQSVQRDELLQKCKAQGLITYTKLFDKIDIRLTEPGKTYLERATADNRRRLFSWIRDGIATAIALAALIVSIFK